MRVEIINDIFVRRIGVVGATKLICLHGFGDSGQMFVPLSGTVLSEQFELFLIDLPGFGASPARPGIRLIEDYARAVGRLASAVSPDVPVGLIGHSIASAIAVDAVKEMSPPTLGVFSMEGNLTEEDAYFSGKAADWDSAELFHEAFTEEIWQLSQRDAELRRYFAGVIMADASAMWTLGKDAKRVSVGDGVGHSYKDLEVPTLYYWSRATTSERTRQFIRKHSLPNRQYEAESHWPTVADPQATATAIIDFFDHET